MKSKLFRSSMWLFVVPAILCTACGGNYKYVYKSSCNCIVSKNNPDGIKEISVFPYTTDPSIHEHNQGFFQKFTTNKVTSFSMADYSPADFHCYPCLTFSPGQKYVFCFQGKGDMGMVEIPFSKDDKGKLKLEKAKKSN